MELTTSLRPTGKLAFFALLLCGTAPEAQPIDTYHRTWNSARLRLTRVLPQAGAVKTLLDAALFVAWCVLCLTPNAEAQLIARGSFNSATGIQLVQLEPPGGTPTAISTPNAV